jgi:hypothetical protein
MLYCYRQLFLALAVVVNRVQEAPSELIRRATSVLGHLSQLKKVFRRRHRDRDLDFPQLLHVSLPELLVDISVGLSGFNSEVARLITSLSSKRLFRVKSSLLASDVIRSITSSTVVGVACSVLTNLSRAARANKRGCILFLLSALTDSSFEGWRLFDKAMSRLETQYVYERTEMTSKYQSDRQETSIPVQSLC